MTFLAFLIVPFLLVMPILVKISSPGPVIHKRLVMGMNGKQFHAYKFRTMVVDDNEVLEKHPDLIEKLSRNHKLKNDPLSTKIGAFPRKFSLD